MSELQANQPTKGESPNWDDYTDMALVRIEHIASTLEHALGSENPTQALTDLLASLPEQFEQISHNLRSAIELAPENLKNPDS